MHSLHEETYAAILPQFEARAPDFMPFWELILDVFTQYVPGKNILDVGCGIGLGASVLANRGYHVTGIDISESLVQRAQERVPTARFLAGDFFEMNLDENFDGLLACSFVHLFPKRSIDDVLLKLSMALKPEGVAFITTTIPSESKEGFEEKPGYEGRHVRYRAHWLPDELEHALSERFNILNYFEKEGAYGKNWMHFTVRPLRI